MIDIPGKTVTLVEQMQAALPINAEIGRQAHKALRKELPDSVLPNRCQITSIYYAGDEGGILCTLEFDPPDTKKRHIISITHLTFDRRTPLSHEIRVYQKHRVKRLRKLGG